MHARPFGRTGRNVSEIGFGAWAIGGSWGDVEERDAIDALNAALDAGVTFIDTADVYGDGRSEKIVAKVLKDRPKGSIYVATKAGRRVHAGGRRLHLRESQRLDRAQPAKSRRRDARPAATALPADRALLPPGSLRHARPHQGRRQDSRLWRQRREDRRGAEGDRVSRRRQRPDHLQHLSPAPDGAVFRRRQEAQRRDHRARAAGQRPAHRQAQQGVDLRRHRPPQVQPQRRALRHGRDVFRRALRRRPRRRRKGARARRAATRRWRNSRCAGF